MKIESISVAPSYKSNYTSKSILIYDNESVGKTFLFQASHDNGCPGHKTEDMAMLILVTRILFWDCFWRVNVRHKSLQIPKSFNSRLDTFDGCTLCRNLVFFLILCNRNEASTHPVSLYDDVPWFFWSISAWFFGRQDINSRCEDGRQIMWLDAQLDTGLHWIPSTVSRFVATKKGLVVTAMCVRVAERCNVGRPRNQELTHTQKD